MAGNVLDERIDFDNAKSVEWELGKRFRINAIPSQAICYWSAVVRQLVDSRLVGAVRDFCLMGSVILIKPNKERVDSRFLSAL